MGLDMYLSADLYLWNYKDEDGKLAKQIEGIIGNLPPVDGTSFRDNRIKSVGMDVMYWRKANAIHQWFVDNVQEGDDDCKRYLVEEEQLKELADICKQVIDIYDKPDDQVAIDEDKETLIEWILPTSSGFFFGSQEYDDCYIAEVRRTYDGLTKFLDSDIAKRCDFYYQASW